MTELDPKAQTIVDAVRRRSDADAPTRRDKDRIKRRVLARVAATALAASAGAASTTSAASAGAAGVAGAGAAGAGATTTGLVAAKVALVGIATSVLVVAAAATGVVATRAREPRPTAVHVIVTEASGAEKGARLGGTPPLPTVATAAAPVPPPAVGSSVAIALALDTERPSLPPTAAAANTTPRGPASHAATPAGPREIAPGTLEQELPLLRGAQEALRAGDLDRALSLLDAHARGYPDGALAEERRAAHAIATCLRTPGAAARAEADAFVRDAPSSPLVERVTEVCSSAPRPR